MVVCSCLFPILFSLVLQCQELAVGQILALGCLFALFCFVVLLLLSYWIAERAYSLLGLFFGVFVTILFLVVGHAICGVPFYLHPSKRNLTSRPRYLAEKELLSQIPNDELWDRDNFTPRDCQNFFLLQKR